MPELDARAASNKRNQVAFEEFMPRLEGSLAVFKERPLITVVKVSQISSDDQFMRCILTDVTSPGLLSLPRRSSGVVQLAASWDVFSGNERGWHASYISWGLFFDREVVEKVLALGREAAERGATLQYGHPGTAFDF